MINVKEVMKMSIALICFVVSSMQVMSSDVPGTKPIISYCNGIDFGCAVFDNKKIKCWGYKDSIGSLNTYGKTPSTVGDFIPYLNVSNSIPVDKVSCGHYHLCVKLESGDVKCLGNNNFYQVGAGVRDAVVGEPNGFVGDNLPAVQLGGGLQALDVALGYYHSCVVVTGNKVKCYGDNSFGVLGQEDETPRGGFPSEMGDNLPFTELGTGVEVASIHSNNQAFYTCVILLKPTQSAGRIKCWGNGSYAMGYGDQNNRGANPGEMGDNLPLVDLGTESRVKQISLSSGHTCALLFSDALKCWGFGAYGKVGSGSTSTITSTGNSMPFVQIDSGKTVKQISTGIDHTCIIYDDMITMKCFGRNDCGQLGQGDTIVRGGAPTTLLPSIPAIDLGTGSLKIKSIHSGSLFNCVLFEDNSLKCFGESYFGQLANAVDTDGIGDEPYEMGTNLTFSALFSPTASPTKSPTPPTKSPTKSPSTSPTKKPSKNPTKSPTRNPTSTPSVSPTTKPTSSYSEPTHYKSIMLAIGAVLVSLIYFI